MRCKRLPAPNLHSISDQASQACGLQSIYLQPGLALSMGIISDPLSKNLRQISSLHSAFILLIWVLQVTWPVRERSWAPCWYRECEVLQLAQPQRYWNAHRNMPHLCPTKWVGCPRTEVLLFKKCAKKSKTTKVQVKSCWKKEKKNENGPVQAATAPQDFSSTLLTVVNTPTLTASVPLCVEICLTSHQRRWGGSHNPLLGGGKGPLEQ